MSSTNQRCSLLIRGVIYQSAGVNYFSAEKKFECPKQTQKGSQAKNLFLLVHLGTMTQLFMKKKISHFTIPLRGHVSFYNKYIYLKTFWVIFISSGMYIMTLVLKTCCRLLLWNIVRYTFPNKAVDYTISKLENSLQFAISDYGIIYRLYKFLRNFEHLLI